MSTEAIRVVVRCRPFNNREKEAGSESVCTVDSSSGSVSLKDQKGFTFDASFGPETQQQPFFEQTARHIVDAVLDGFNGTIFAYGQVTYLDLLHVTRRFVDRYRKDVYNARRLGETGTSRRHSQYI